MTDYLSTGNIKAGEMKPGDRIINAETGAVIITILDRLPEPPVPIYNQNDTTAVLRAAAERLGNGWCKGKLGMLYDDQGPVCLNGAIAWACRTCRVTPYAAGEAGKEFNKFLRKQGWGDSNARWNDTRTDVSEIQTALQQCADQLENN